MPDITIHNVPDHLIAFHMAQAAQEGVDIEQHLMRIIQKEAPSRRAEIIAKIAQLRNDIKIEYGVLNDSTPLIREFRDAL